MRVLRLFLLRRFGPIGVALTVYDVWRRLPTRRRRWLVAHGRRLGLRIATRAWAFVAETIGR
jgi:uncharacterized membrane protein